jgi:HEAT repeat protein
MRQMAKTISQVAAGLCALSVWVGFTWGEDAPTQPAEKPPEWRIKGCAAALADRDPKVVGEVLLRGYCREAWAFVGKEYVPVIAKNLKAEDDPIRQMSIEALAEMGAKDQISAIAEQLLNKNNLLRAEAIEALAVLDAKGQVPNIAQMLKDEDWYIRRTAIEALATLNAKDQIPEIAKLLKDEEWGIRSSAIEALVRLDAKDQAPAIADLFANKEGHLMDVAFKALKSLGAKEQMSAIAKQIKDQDRNKRIAAVKALAELGAKEQIPAIFEVLKKDNESVRVAAVEALAALGAKEKVSYIAELLQDKDGYMRQAAVDALARLEAKEQVSVIAKQLNDGKAYVRVAAIIALAKLSAKDQVSAIAEKLKDKDFSVRFSAIDALVALGAKEQISAIVPWLKDMRSEVRESSVAAIAALNGKEQVLAIAGLLIDENEDVQYQAIHALVELGAKEYAPAIAKRINNKEIRESNFALESLLNLEANEVTNLALILEIPENDSSRYAELVAFTHVLGGGNENVETALRWLYASPTPDDKPDTATINRALAAYLYFWENKSANAPKLHEKMSDNISRLVYNNASLVYKKGSTELNLSDVVKVRNLLPADDQANSNLLREALLVDEHTKILLMIGKGWVLHLLFWGLLIFAYPRYRPVQAIFFWNPWVRKLLGLGYVGFLLTWSPRLRRRLLSPFREVLLADARLSEFDETAYFRDSLVASTGKPTRPLVEELARLRGQVLLEGDSGLGKTSFIRQHLKQSKRLAVYLPAPRCGKGVLMAIQAKLKGYAEDERFLKSLIYSGALDVYIDGLNEAAPEVRAQITQFAEDFFRANLLLSSQPMKWEPPASVRTLILQALDEQRIADFLSSRPLPQDAILSTEEYQRKVSEFLALHLSQEADGESIQRVRVVLSNPLDLSVVSEMLARGEMPDVFNLQQQFFELMALDYAAENAGQAFPFHAFAESVYTLRQQNEWMGKLRETWATELDYLAKHRLMIRRDVESGNVVDKQTVTRWYFRHDKIQDFFLSEAFADSIERQNQHMGDARFRGVYLYLAHRLPLPQAQDLRERLTDYAADHADHTVSDTYIKLLRTRQDWVSSAGLNSRSRQRQHSH